MQGVIFGIKTPLETKCKNTCNHVEFNKSPQQYTVAYSTFKNSHIASFFHDFVLTEIR